jgi:hypothetical protein
MTSDEWLILLMGIALACAPMILAWTEERTRARGIAIPAILTVKGYRLSPHMGFSLVIAVMLLSISYQMRGSGLSFVFLVFGVAGLIVVLNNVQRTRRGS